VRASVDLQEEIELRCGPDVKRAVELDFVLGEDRGTAPLYQGCVPCRDLQLDDLVVGTGPKRIHVLGKGEGGEQGGKHHSLMIMKTRPEDLGLSRPESQS